MSTDCFKGLQQLYLSLAEKEIISNIQVRLPQQTQEKITP